MDAEDVGFTHIDELDGLITPEVGRVLHRYAMKVPAGQAIVELGSYHGKSTAFLALGSRDGNDQLVYAVDTWSEEHSAWRSSVMARIPSPKLETFQEQLASLGLLDRVEPYTGTTTDAAAEYADALHDNAVDPVGLLYVDADHSYDAVMADFNVWRDLMAPDGVMIFDDYTKSNPGVVRALRELRDTGRIKPLAVEAERLVPAYVGDVR